MKLQVLIATETAIDKLVNRINESIKQNPNIS